MNFAIEPLETVWDEIYEPPQGLAYRHWSETQGFRHYQGYAPSKERYLQYEKGGWFIQFTVRNEGVLVGYGGAYVFPSMHSGRLIATEDTWFILPEHRSGWNAIKFYKFMERVCEERGAWEATLTLPAYLNLDPIVIRLGYNLGARQYFKQLAPSRQLTNPELRVGDVCT